MDENILMLVNCDPIVRGRRCAVKLTRSVAQLLAKMCGQVQHIGRRSTHWGHGHQGYVCAVGGKVGGPFTSSFSLCFLCFIPSFLHSPAIRVSPSLVYRWPSSMPQAIFPATSLPLFSFLSVARSPRHHQRHLAIDARILSLSLYIYIYIGV
jgi:hypothetical protein